MANKNHSTRSRFKYLLTAIAVLCCTAIGVAYAAGSGVNASGSVSAGILSVGLTQMSPFTFKNEVPVIAQPLVITNNTQTSSQQGAQLQVDFIGDGYGPRLISETQLWVWPIQTGTICSTSTPIPSGTNATNLSDGATFSTQLAPGQSQTYCVRMQANLQNLYFVTGTISGIALKATASLSVGNFATSSSSSSNISTYSMYTYIVPPNAYYQLVSLSSDLCLDVSGGTNARPGSSVGVWTCSTSTASVYGNQWYRFNDPNGNNGTYSTMQPSLPAGTGTQVGATYGSGVTAELINASLPAQQWVTQLTDYGQDVYQLVSKDSGLCLTILNASTTATAPCANIATQRFTLKKVNVPVPASETSRFSEETSPTPDTDESDKNQAQSGGENTGDNQSSTDTTANTKSDTDITTDIQSGGGLIGEGSGFGVEDDLDSSRGVEGAEDE